MNKLPVLVALFFCVFVLAISSHQGVASTSLDKASQVRVQATNATNASATHDASTADDSAAAETFGTKKCSFASDCSHGKCSKNRCGSCSFASDCKGWGKCSKGWCGACSFSSDCKGFGPCKSGRCAKSPY